MKAVWIALMLALIGMPAVADRWDFNRFGEARLNLPGSYQRLRDNFEGVEARRIHGFSI